MGGTADGTTKMPEPLVFGRAFLVGLVGAEIARIAYRGGERFSSLLLGQHWAWSAGGILGVLLTAAVYFYCRDGAAYLFRLGKSRRIDLFLAVIAGAWVSELVAPWLMKLHRFAESMDPRWPPTFIAVIVLMMLSSLWGTFFQPKPRRSQLYFLTDDEISSDREDVLDANKQALGFAEAVLASDAHSGIVFGVDAPWGTGKTSFLNLAQKHWETVAEDRVIVFRFEPLRYAGELDLTDKFIRDLSATIQRQVYVPEFRPAATRYSRMLKGKTEFSFLGAKFTLEPSNETVDELLIDINDVLKRIQKRVIVIIDDLDRLDIKAVNSVLFTIRRTFKLTQAAYILCYDTEMLVDEKEDSERARLFLEKFVNVKLSLFVDTSALINFLRYDWKSDEAKYQSVPSDTMAKLGSILTALENILRTPSASAYMPLIGDLRKLKRFVNAVLLMQLEKTDLSKSDFNAKDLVHLALLHLNHPNIFRSIYAQETEGRTGSFSVVRSREGGSTNFSSAPGLEAEIDRCGTRSSAFLLRQLFDAQTIGLDTFDETDEGELSSRACFNSGSYRNLERYLKLIVRFATPEPRDMFKTYQDAVDRVVKNNERISTVLSEPVFRLADEGPYPHDQFWRILVSRAYDFRKPLVDEVINTILELLPQYPAIDNDGRGLRQRLVYSLIRVLDRAGWASADRRLPNSSENIVEIAHRIFGEHEYAGAGLIERLTSSSRGALGWGDLMLFRLQCSADRGGQNFNLHGALIVREDLSAQTSGITTVLALRGMRTLSQRIYAHFHATYIAPERNFFDELDSTDDSSFLGSCEGYYLEKMTGLLPVS